MFILRHALFTLNELTRVTVCLLFKDEYEYANDDIELLQLVIQSLQDLDKAIVILYLEGYQNKEIAGMLKLSASTVSTRLNRIKSSLKRKFKTHSYEAGQP